MIGPVRTNLVVTGYFFLKVVLVDDRMVCQHIVGNTGKVHLEQAGCLVSSVPDKPLVTPPQKIASRTLESWCNIPRRPGFLEDHVWFVG